MAPGAARACRWVAAALAALATCEAGAAGLFGLSSTFVDEQDRARRLGDFARPGATVVVAMEYTECRFVCSTGWRRLVDLQAEADRQHRELQFVIVSLDPEHDTPALWREYRQMRGMGRSNWVFLTGSRDSTDRVARALGVRWWRYDGAIMHDFRIVRLDAQGQPAKALDDYGQPVASLLNP